MFQPLRDYLLVKVHPPEAEVNGLLIPKQFQTARQRDQGRHGTIVAIGPGRVLETGERLKPSVKINDVVVFGTYAGVNAPVVDDQHVLIQEADILVVLG